MDFWVKRMAGKCLAYPKIIYYSLYTKYTSDYVLSKYFFVVSKFFVPALAQTDKRVDVVQKKPGIKNKRNIIQHFMINW